jgi:hypothetical protein
MTSPKLALANHAFWVNGCVGCCLCVANHAFWLIMLFGLIGRASINSFIFLLGYGLFFLILNIQRWKAIVNTTACLEIYS